MINRQSVGVHIATAHFPAVPTPQNIIDFIKVNEEFCESYNMSAKYMKIILDNRLRVLQHYRGNQPAPPIPDGWKFDPKLDEKHVQLASDLCHKDAFAVYLDDMRVEGEGKNRVLVLPRKGNAICEVLALQVFRINEFSPIIVLKDEVDNVFDEIDYLKESQRELDPDVIKNLDVPPVCTQRVNVFVKFTNTNYTPPPKSAFERVW